LIDWLLFSEALLPGKPVRNRPMPPDSRTRAMREIVIRKAVRLYLNGEKVWTVRESLIGADVWVVVVGEVLG
jgi:hypothetical protein